MKKIKKHTRILYARIIKCKGVQTIIFSSGGCPQITYYSPPHAISFYVYFSGWKIFVHPHKYVLSNVLIWYLWNDIDVQNKDKNIKKKNENFIKIFQARKQVLVKSVLGKL